MKVRPRSGWLTFSAVLLILAGAFRIFDAFWAFKYDDEVTTLQSLFFDHDLATWGWIYLVLGIILILGGLYALRGSPWASLVGMVLAGISALVALPFLYSRPGATLMYIALAVIVMYGLSDNFSDNPL
jgi:hypothetical protein